MDKDTDMATSPQRGCRFLMARRHMSLIDER